MERFSFFAFVLTLLVMNGIESRIDSRCVCYTICRLRVVDPVFAYQEVSLLIACDLEWSRITLL